MKLWQGIAAGMAGGAVGTTALNAVTYLDMAMRGRPASSTPEQSVEKLAKKLGVEIPGDESARKNRVAGLGPLLGLATGVGVGATLGAARALGFRPNPLLGAILLGGGAMAMTNAAMAGLKVTDPRTWGVKGWLSDAIPHLAYGLATAAVLRGLDRR